MKNLFLIFLLPLCLYSQQDYGANRGRFDTLKVFKGSQISVKSQVDFNFLIMCDSVKSHTPASVVFVNDTLRALYLTLDNALDTAYSNSVSDIASLNSFLSIETAGKKRFFDITTLTTTNGGIGSIPFVQGDIVYYNAGTALSRLGKTSSATRYLSNTGTSNNPAWAQVDLSNGVTGTLDTANSAGVSNVIGNSPITIATAGKTKFVSADTTTRFTGLVTQYDRVQDSLTVITQLEDTTLLSPHIAYKNQSNTFTREQKIDTINSNTTGKVLINDSFQAGKDSVIFQNYIEDFTTIWNGVEVSTVSINCNTDSVYGNSVGLATHFLTYLTAGDSIRVRYGLASQYVYFSIASVVNDTLLITNEIYDATCTIGNISGKFWWRYDTLDANSAQLKYKNGSFSITGDTSLFPIISTTGNRFLYYPTKYSLFVGRKTSLFDSTFIGTGSQDFGYNNSVLGDYSLVSGYDNTITATGDYSFVHGGSNYLTSLYSGIVGLQDSIYSNNITGQNFIFGNNNVIGRTNPTGSYGNWLFGQYIHTEGLGNWVLGADDSFEKRLVPTAGTIVHLNETVLHWGGNNMGLFSILSDGWQSDKVKDTVRYQFEYQKRGSATDSLAHASFNLTATRSWNRDAYGVFTGNNYYKIFLVINKDDDDAIHWNYVKTDPRPWGNMYLDTADFFVSKGNLTVSRGYVDADSIRDDGTTRATTATWHSGIGAWSLGALTTAGITTNSGLSSFGGTNSGRATVGAGDSVQVSISGFTTSGEVQVSYYGANSTFTKHAHWGYRRAGGFTIYGDAGAIVSYFVHKK